MGAVIAICLLGGIGSGVLAVRKRRSVVTWIMIGLVPVLGLAVLAALPSLGFVYSARRRHHVMNETTVAQRTHLESATLDAVARLVELRDRGQLTPYEFQERRAELLARL